MVWFELVLKRLALLLQTAGVPNDKLDIFALAVFYVAVVLIVLLLILLLLKIVSRKGAGDSAIEKSSVALEAEAETEVKSEVEAEAEVKSEVKSEVEAEAEAEPVNLLARFRAGIAKTRSALIGRVDALLSSGRKIDADLFEDLEEVLITADLGLSTTQKLMTALEVRAKGEGLKDAVQLRSTLMTEMAKLLVEVEPFSPREMEGPFVLMVVGVNGVGKTTTIGKLARRFTQQGLKVVLGAGDTFRAAAAEQLVAWGERAGVDVIRHGEGADPSAVAFDAAHAALARKADLLILDTAGRLHTQVNLMEELKKMRRVLAREIPGAPHSTLLVVDATTGQNALTQARQFNEIVGIDGIALTKLDGTAKGGIVIAIACELGLPVRYVGVGEGADDLQEFNPQEFVSALFEN